MTGDDLLVLGEQGHVAEVDWWKQWALYDVGAVRRLGATKDGRGVGATVVAGRQAWLADSVMAT